MLQVTDVTVIFGGITAVKDVSFHVRGGEILGLIGPNGAGKTTLIRAITGNVTISRGRISLESIPLNHMPAHRRIRLGIGLSQQIVHPFNSMSILENVAFVAGRKKTENPMMSVFRLSRIKEKQKAIKILELLGIDHIAGEMHENLPLGYLKRLEVARALALEPKILLLDEPLAGLNQKEARRLADKLVELNRIGYTILLIEHNLGEVIRICNRLVVIDNGIMIGHGEPRSVMENPGVRKAYLGEDHHAVS
jgi:branched-chain amino acid transport system ATP-binding protein